MSTLKFRVVYSFQQMLPIATLIAYIYGLVLQLSIAVCITISIITICYKKTISSTIYHTYIYYMFKLQICQYILKYHLNFSLPHLLYLQFERLNSSVRQELNSLRDNGATESRLTRIEMDFSQKLAALGNNLTSQVQTASRVPGPKGDPVSRLTCIG